MKIGVQIEFLGAVQLADPASPRIGEWPPAPDRIFQALVATAAETGQAMHLLTHLESAPAVQASRAQLDRGVVHYVPENYRRPDRYHKGAARYLPTVHPVSPVVVYLWDGVPDEAVESLRGIVERLTHVGRASSLVRATLVDPRAVTPDWVPDARGERLMRSPYPGRLAELQAAYRDGRRSSAAPTMAYRDASQCYPATGWGDLMVLRPDRQLDAADTVRWAGQMRRAVMSKAPEEMPAIIHGHGDHRHVAWAAIPDVGHKYASGGILGLGCWLPEDVSLQERGLLGACMMKVTGIGKIGLQLDERGLKGLQASTWSRASRVWASATPIALDRWPKHNKPAEQVVADSLEAMGLPRPASVACSNHSPLRGAANARRYRSRNGNRYITHAVIEWRTPVAGPLLIGADRYFGSGLCRPLGDGR